jgi:hypothetical protein
MCHICDKYINILSRYIFEASSMCDDVCVCACVPARARVCARASHKCYNIVMLVMNCWLVQQYMYPKSH